MKDRHECTNYEDKDSIEDIEKDTGPWLRLCRCGGGGRCVSIRIKGTKFVKIEEWEIAQEDIFKHESNGANEQEEEESIVAVKLMKGIFDCVERGLDFFF
jgi:hypothetical protein